MKYEERKIDDVMVLKIGGEITISLFQELWSRLDEIARQGRNFVLVDLTGVSHMDHAGWLHIMETRNKMCVHGGEVALCIGTGILAETFRVAGLDRLIIAYTSLEAGLDGISPKRRELNAVTDSLESLLFGRVLDVSMTEEAGTGDPTVAHTEGVIERVLEIDSSPENHLEKEDQEKTGGQGKIFRWLSKLLDTDSE